MKISNKDFTFFGRKKKKKNFPSLEALKLISFVTGTALAANRALKERVRQQHISLHRKKEAQAEETALIIAGFVGGVLAGAISALLFTPESGGDLRKRITGYFDNGNGHETVKKAKQTAKKKAGEVEDKINGSV